MKREKHNTLAESAFMSQIRSEKSSKKVETTITPCEQTVPFVDINDVIYESCQRSVSTFKSSTEHVEEKSIQENVDAENLLKKTAAAKQPGDLFSKNTLKNPNRSRIPSLTSIKEVGKDSRLNINTPCPGEEKTVAKVKQNVEAPENGEEKLHEPEYLVRNQTDKEGKVKMKDIKEYISPGGLFPRLMTPLDRRKTDVSIDDTFWLLPLYSSRNNSRHCSDVNLPNEFIAPLSQDSGLNISSNF